MSLLPCMDYACDANQITAYDICASSSCNVLVTQICLGSLTILIQWDSSKWTPLYSRQPLYNECSLKSQIKLPILYSVY